MSNAYYYSDSNFELELNLQHLRRHLVQMLDEFEQRDCRKCDKIKCQCDIDNSADTHRIGGTPAHSPGQILDPPTVRNTAPPASSLPKPEFGSSSSNSQEYFMNYDIDSWVCSTPTKSANVTPKREKNTERSIWDDELRAAKVYSPLIGQSSVEVFFRNFSSTPMTPTLASSLGHLISSVPAYQKQLPTMLQGVKLTTKPPYEYKYSYF